MPEVRATTVVPLAQADVFDFVGDSRNAPRWVWGIHAAETDGPHPLRPGDDVVFQLVAKGRLLESRWRIEAWEPPVRVASSGQALGARAHLEIACRALGPQETAVEETLRYALPGGPLGLIADRFGVHGILEMHARNSMQQLRRVLLDGRAARRTSRPGRARRPAAGPTTDGR